MGMFAGNSENKTKALPRRTRRKSENKDEAFLVEQVLRTLTMPRIQANSAHTGCGPSADGLDIRPSRMPLGLGFVGFGQRQHHCFGAGSPADLQADREP